MIWAYRGFRVGDQDTSWTLHICCVTCVRLLTKLVNGSRQIQLAFPVVWRELEEHSSTDTTGITSKFKQTMKYPDLPSAMRTVPHRTELLVPKLPLIFSDDNSDSDENRDQQEGKMLTPFRHLKQVVPNLNHICENKKTLTTWPVNWICLKNKLDSQVPD